jgi:regulator of cell morphogenesis and NO signaling
MQTASPVTLSQSVANIVIDHSETALVFQRHRIDFCCRGHLSVEQAARERGVDIDALMKQLGDVIAERRAGVQASTTMRDWSTPDLIAHIVDKHHAYLRKTLPYLRPLAKKVARVHGDHDPKLRALEVTVDELTEVLLPHLDEEETRLFPALRATVGAPAPETSAQLATMVDDHLEVAALLERVREQTDNYTIHDWACGSVRTLFRELEAVERDTLTHVHLENHVLRPRFEPANTRVAKHESTRFDLASEAAALRGSPGWVATGLVAKTLLRTDDARVLLLALRAGTIIPEHSTDHAVLVQAIAGRVQVATRSAGATELVAPALLFLSAGTPHDLIAYDDSIVLVTIDWHGAPDGAELTLPVPATRDVNHGE